MAVGVLVRRVEALEHVQGVAVEGLGLAVLAPRLQQEAQVVEGRAQVGVAVRVLVRRVEALEHVQGVAQVRLGLGVLAPRLQQ